MNFVEPIRDKNDIEKMKTYLKNKNERDYILFLIGLNTGLRISDILTLKVKDVNGEHINIREKKTGKQKMVLIHPQVKKILKEYTEEKLKDEYIICSREGCNKPLTRSQAYNILNNAARCVSIEGNIGTHTMRKTYGYHYYKKTTNIVILQQLFNHAHPAITLRYIGINQDILDDEMKKFSL